MLKNSLPDPDSNSIRPLGTVAHIHCVPFLKQLLLRNCAVDFVEICNVYVGKMTIKAAKRIFNSDQIRHSYSDLNFGVTFLEHSVQWFSPLSHRDKLRGARTPLDSENLTNSV